MPAAPFQEKAAEDLAAAESQRATLEAERKSLRSEAEQAKTLGQTLAREKSLVETSRKVPCGRRLQQGRRRLPVCNRAMESKGMVVWVFPAGPLVSYSTYVIVRSFSVCDVSSALLPTFKVELR